jgi:hypothetical protein
MGTIRCTETSVKDYHSTLRSTEEEDRSHQHRGGSLKSRITDNRLSKVAYVRFKDELIHISQESVSTAVNPGHLPSEARGVFGYTRDMLVGKLPQLHGVVLKN